MNEIESQYRYGRYKVLARTSLPRLEEEIEEWMSRGYRPAGGCSVREVNGGVHYLQAVVLEGERYDSD